ncbi:hypothetical protein UlMin_009570 [Ulmus minor]
MAGANCTTFSFLKPTIRFNSRRTKLLLLATVQTPPKPTKILRRRNYLRPKILKVLTKPYSPPPNPILPQQPTENPVIPITSPETPIEELQSNRSGENFVSVEGEEEKVEEFGSSETSGRDNGRFGEFSGRSVLRFGGYLIVLFVFQTICAVWVLGNGDTEKRKGSNLGKGKVLLGGNGPNGKFLGSKSGSQMRDLVLVDEYQLEEKIEEIRGMAREARNAERKKLRYESGSDDKSLISRTRIGIEKEIGARLVKLQKRLNSDKEKLPGSSVSYLSKSEKVEDDVSRNSLNVDNLSYSEKVEDEVSRNSWNVEDLSKYEKVGDGESGNSSNGDNLSKNEEVGNGVSGDSSNVDDLSKFEKVEVEVSKISSNVDDLSKFEEFEVEVSKISSNVENLSKYEKVGDGVSGNSLNVVHLNKSENVGDGISGTSSNMKKDNEMLMFKKKLKFQSPLTETRKSPKGFGGFENSTKEEQSGLGAKSTENGNVGNDAMDMELPKKEDEEIQQKSNSSQRGQNSLENGMGRENGGKGVGFGRTSLQRKSRNGVIQESRLGRSSRRTSRELGMKNGAKRRAKKSNVGIDMWWLKLPYVLVVLMHRDSNPEGASGLFTIRTAEAHEHDSAYTVAFEDRGDATNFSYLLETFFEDLGDFRADIIPLPISELKAAIHSTQSKFVVVKKGQLQLYAGQPFLEVERALFSLVKQNQCS